MEELARAPSEHGRRAMMQGENRVIDGAGLAAETPVNRNAYQQPEAAGVRGGLDAILGTRRAGRSAERLEDTDAAPMRPSRAWFLAGVFFTTAATLCMEILNIRLLSVISWYHLSFFAVSTAMFGMSAGALHVYLRGDDYHGAGALRALSKTALLLAVAIPLSHLVVLVVPVDTGMSTVIVCSLLVLTIALAVPFYLSGVIVTLSLTRVPGRIGLTYAVDLAGAALGTLLVVPLLEGSNITSVFLICAAMAAVSALCFRLCAGAGWSWTAAALSLLLVTGASYNRTAIDPVRVWYHKGNSYFNLVALKEYWNIYSEVLVSQTLVDKPQYWGAGDGAEAFRVPGFPMGIDGVAGTTLASWDGRSESLEWVEYDVTSLAYHLRRGADVAVIGVGGGRDILAALRAGSRSIRGIEINKIFLDLLRGEKRTFAGIANRPEVRFVHDEARSYLTRTKHRFDVLQMSLIDTFASTGAGAMTLTENGLYTREGWKVFLDVLKPTGLFSVSRWYDPKKVSETSRLLALGTAALLDRGVRDPDQHLAVVQRGAVSTLVLSPSRLSRDDVATIHATAKRFGFHVLAAPDRRAEDPQIAAIVTASSDAALRLATQHALYDYSPPTDERPFFFNLLKPSRALKMTEQESSAGVVGGNVVATTTLLLLFFISLLLVVCVIVLPLVMSGLPRMRASSFALSIWYFAAIGLGFMFVQIPTMQRFSVYLGHPTYAVVVILFSMILAAGVGSLVSDRLPIESSRRLVIAVPLAIAAVILLLTQTIQPAINHTIRFGLPARCAIVVLLVAPLAALLGFCFPIGMRLVRRLSEDAMPWMWGVNGACGVLAAVSAVAISMWWGIHTNLHVALLLYASLALVAPVLWRQGLGAQEQ
jgi:SAM-dependent methyltransferase